MEEACGTHTTVFTKMGCMLSADGSGDDLLRIQGLEEVAFGFEYSDRHRNAKRIILMGTWNKKGCACDPVALLMSLIRMGLQMGLQMKRRWCLLRLVFFYDALPPSIE